MGQRVSFSKSRIQEAQAIVAKWQALNSVVESNDCDEIAKAIEDAKKAQVCEEVLKKAKQQLDALKQLENSLCQRGASGSARLVEIAMKGALIYGVKGKLL